jgi:hypothetical protein
MLGVEPEELSAQQWKSFAHHWQSYNKTSTPMQAHCFHMNEVFVNCSDKDEIYPLATEEIAEAQQADTSLKHRFKRNAVIDQGLEIKFIENMICVCKDGRLLSRSNSRCMQSNSITTTYSTLDTHVSKRR